MFIFGHTHLEQEQMNLKKSFCQFVRKTDENEEQKVGDDL